MTLPIAPPLLDIAKEAKERARPRPERVTMPDPASLPVAEVAAAVQNYRELVERESVEAAKLRGLQDERVKLERQATEDAKTALLAGKPTAPARRPVEKIVGEIADQQLLDTAMREVATEADRQVREALDRHRADLIPPLAARHAEAVADVAAVLEQLEAAFARVDEAEALLRWVSAGKPGSHAGERRRGQVKPYRTVNVVVGEHRWPQLLAPLRRWASPDPEPLTRPGDEPMTRERVERDLAGAAALAGPVDVGGS